MTFGTSHHARALAAAAGLVGRPRLRAGLLLTLVAACGPGTFDPDTASASDTSSSSEAPSTSTSTTTATGTTTLVTTSDGATGEDATTSTTTTTGDPSTGATTEATLLTDATTTTSTTTGDTDTGASTGTGSSTGELEDCVDVRTGEMDWECCEAQNWEPAPQCTPWGPPAPPAALRERLQRARAARGRWV